MKPYPAYKDSGIEWIGEIPEHWNVVKLKRLLQSQLKYGANESAELDDESYPRYIRITDFGDDGKLRKETFKSLPMDKAKEYLLCDGDVLFARSGATVGKTFLFSNYQGLACFAGYLIKATPNTNHLNSQFLYLFTKSNSYDCWKNSIFIQATIQNIGADKYNILDISIPPIEEQKSIIKYLNHKTSQIDTLIEKKQKQIELLKEERTAIINQAVTKGLNPDVPMKDSGIEWLGEVPEHWEIKPLKYITKINDRVLSENTDKNYQIQYIDIGNVGQGYLINPPTEMIFGDAPSRARRILKRRDVIISTVRTYLKAIAYIEFEDANLVASTGFAVISATNSIDSKYLYYMLSSQRFIDTVSSNSVGVSYPAITSTQISLIPVCYPPSIEEQKAVVKLIENDALQIDNIITIIQQQITFLQEYHTALISNAVTGKIDLRDTPTASLQ